MNIGIGVYIDINFEKKTDIINHTARYRKI